MAHSANTSLPELSPAPCGYPSPGIEAPAASAHILLFVSAFQVYCFPRLTITVDLFCSFTPDTQDRYSPDPFPLWLSPHNRCIVKLFVQDKPVPTFPAREGRRSKRIAMRKGASVVVNLGSKPQRVPCLIVDRSPEGFRVRGGFRLKRGQLVEVIPNDDELNAIQCSVVWIGKPGSKQDGEIGLKAV